MRPLLARGLQVAAGGDAGDAWGAVLGKVSDYGDLCLSCYRRASSGKAHEKNCPRKPRKEST